MIPVASLNPAILINTNCGNVTDSFNNFNVLVSDEKRQVLEWLSPLASRERHHAIRDSRMDRVGDWLLRDQSFSKWCTLDDEEVKPVLSCYGDPGVGKTYISSLVIDKLSAEIAGDGVAVAYVYCDFNTENVQSAGTVLGSVLRQVVGSLTEIPEEVQEAFERAKRQVDSCGLRIDEILEMLTKSLSGLKRSFICIDALDEFPLKHRPDLWEIFQRVLHRCSNVRLFLTLRPHIRDQVRKYFPTKAEMLQISPRENDIELYLSMRLSKDAEDDEMDEGLRADILRVIRERISGIFLLVSLSIDAILAEPTIHDRREALHRMTNGLGLRDAYNTTLDRIGQQGGNKAKMGMEVLMWISRCERPMRPEELRHALGVELGTEDLNIDKVPSIRTALGCTLGLATIDEKAPTVRLVHLTLQQYLRGSPNLFVTAHSMMAEICLTYLNYRSVRVLPPNFATTLETKPFLEYAACFWGTHAAREVTEPVKSLALQVLDGYENHVSAAVLGRKGIHKLSEKDVQGITGLHCIAFWGITEIAISMLAAKRWDSSRRDSEGDTAFAWAVKYKNEKMVELFLGQGDIEHDIVIQDGRTLLSFAAEWGNEGIVRVLLAHGDVDPCSLDGKGRAPLLFAASRGHEGVVKLLLERSDVDPDTSDNDGQTPLLLAVSQGEETIVELLLKRIDVNPNRSDKDGRTPLFLATSLEYEGVVKLLLARGDVNPNLPDSNGRTALSYAASEGGEAIVKLLLERGDLNPNIPGEGSQTLLLLAVSGGEEVMVKLLLERGDVNPNVSDQDGRTPLLLATSLGHEDIVKVLLERGDVKPNVSDNDGQTPLLLAALQGEEVIMKLLLKRGDINPNLSDNDGRTPLSYAASEGAGGIVKLLLARGDVDPDSPDNDGRTPLSYATPDEEGSLLKLLLARHDVDPNSSDSSGRTPLSYAASEGNEVVVKLLLEHRDVDPDSSDNKGRTPLSFAAREGHEGIVKQLLEREDVNPDSPDNKGRTSLFYAAQRGYEGVVKLFLQHGNVNPNSSDNDGRTSLSFAVWRGHEGVVRLLLERHDVIPNLSDNMGRTPLSFAAEWERDEIVKLFLELVDIDSDTLDNSGRTPLSYAAQWGGEHLVKQFLERGDVNRDSADKNGRTPLSYATARGHQGVAKLFLEPRDVNPNLSHTGGPHAPIIIC